MGYLFHRKSTPFDSLFFNFPSIFDKYESSEQIYQDAKGRSVLKIPLPGWNKKEVEIFVNANQLLIEGRKKNGENISKSYALNVGIDENQVKATLRDGLLEVIFNPYPTKKISVSGAEINDDYHDVTEVREPRFVRLKNKIRGLFTSK